MQILTIILLIKSLTTAAISVFSFECGFFFSFRPSINIAAPLNSDCLEWALKFLPPTTKCCIACTTHKSQIYSTVRRSQRFEIRHWTTPKHCSYNHSRGNRVIVNSNIAHCVSSSSSYCCSLCVFLAIYFKLWKLQVSDAFDFWEFCNSNHYALFSHMVSFKRRAQFSVDVMFLIQIWSIL